MRSFRFAALILLSALCATQAAAQNYPTRAIHIIVPFPAGGPSDVLARLIGDKMSVDFQQPVVVENRPGANTVIGAETGRQGGARRLHAVDGDRFDAGDEPVSLQQPCPTIRSTILRRSRWWRRPSASSWSMRRAIMKSVKDLIAKAKAAPGKLNYGAGTISTKLQGYLFNDAAGIDTVLVPYNGSCRSGARHFDQERRFRVRRTFGGTAADPVGRLARAGQARRPARSRRCPICRRSMPQPACISAISRSGSGSWRRAARRPPIIDKLQGETAKILNDPAIKARADAVGLYLSSSTPAEFAAFIHNEAARWQPVVKKSGMHFD